MKNDKINDKNLNVETIIYGVGHTEYEYIIYKKYIEDFYKEVTNYELPDLGNSYVRTDASGKVIACKSKSESSSCRTQKDLSINQ